MEDYTPSVVRQLEAAFADAVGVESWKVTLTVEPGSVLLTFTVITFSSASAADIEQAIVDTMPDAATASSVLTAGTPDWVSVTITSDPSTKSVAPPISIGTTPPPPTPPSPATEDPTSLGTTEDAVADADSESVPIGAIAGGAAAGGALVILIVFLLGYVRKKRARGRAQFGKEVHITSDMQPPRSSSGKRDTFKGAMHSAHL